MHAALGAQVAVAVAAVDADGDGLEARRLALELVEDLRAEAVALSPAQVHAQQHLGPVGGFGAACPSRDGHDRVALVVRAGEEEAVRSRS